MILDKEVKVAFVGNIYSECGIATYNLQLLNSLKKICNVHFFAENNEKRIEQEGITYCWDRNEFPKIDLIESVEKFKPDVVLFSHEYGIFPKAWYFTNLVSYFKLRSYKVVSIFHSVYEFHKDKLISESICKNVVVHSEEAKQALIRKGLNKENVHVVHHGCSFFDDKQDLLMPLWNHLGNEHIILQAGFLFKYKNHLDMLDVVFEVKKSFPDVVYQILASENPKCQKEHDELHSEIVEKINKLGLNYNVTIDRGFVSPEVLMSYIRSCTAFVLPYRPSDEFDVFAASGMAREAFKTSAPVLVSKANLFSGLDSVADRLESKDEWVQAICDIFNKKNRVSSSLETRRKFIEDNSWDNAALKLKKIFIEAK